MTQRLYYGVIMKGLDDRQNKHVQMVEGIRADTSSDPLIEHFLKRLRSSSGTSFWCQFGATVSPLFIIIAMFDCSGAKLGLISSPIEIWVVVF